jgi:endogenous inhibitor of DNA gyrase (YacG/DUF329 family)
MPAENTLSQPQKERTCPRCGKKFSFTTISACKTFPFCSNRCRDVDLGNWLTGNYKISTPLHPSEDGEDVDQSTDTDGT